MFKGDPTGNNILDFFSQYHQGWYRYVAFESRDGYIFDEQSWMYEFRDRDSNHRILIKQDTHTDYVSVYTNGYQWNKCFRDFNSEAEAILYAIDLQLSSKDLVEEREKDTLESIKTSLITKGCWKIESFFFQNNNIN